ncbi:hypothetical protein [Metapseudomonas otitidis]|uniref:hypothetical protein n=1 Tax=Metapseudomonas otitidis TaxID=319939 RepID=UPI001CA3EA07|nr:hypothetical protein [Pseudomonas otitidis]QZX85316.1 hypothetical protein K6751_11635 [Pseudomonas otitidis]
MARPNNPARPKAVLTPEKVREIRAIGYRLTARQLGQRYGVHHRTIEKIRAFESWGHI